MTSGLGDRPTTSTARRAWQPPAFVKVPLAEACGYVAYGSGPLPPSGQRASADGATGPQPPNPRPTLTKATAGPLPPTPRRASDLAATGPQPPAQSDVRLKENINAIGKTAHGLTLYTFGYKGREGVYEGVMAQEVLEVMPDAVVAGPDGFYRVRYDMLGIPFRRLS